MGSSYLRWCDRCGVSSPDNGIQIREYQWAPSVGAYHASGDLCEACATFVTKWVKKELTKVVVPEAQSDG